MFEVAVVVPNPSAEPLELWCEPWAESMLVAPGRRLTIVGKSPREGRFVVERTESAIVIYTWPGSTAIVSPYEPTAAP